MSKPVQWTRRQFSQALGAGAAASLLGGRARAEGSRGLRGFAYVGSNADGGAIQCFRVAGSRWRPVQTVAAAAPMHLEAHPTLPVLYAVHGVDLWENLPRGAVSAYRIDAASGRLDLLRTQPLSLAATFPRHAAVSPDGRFLLVAAEGGGIYNLLPLAGDGSLGAPAMIRKEIGGAFPRHVIFHPDGGTVLVADAGQGSIGVFAVEQDALRLRERIVNHASCGPSQVAYSPWSGCVYALHEGDGSIAVHRLHGGSLQPTSRIKKGGLTRMVMHPGGRFLVTAADARHVAWSVDARTGELAVCDDVRLHEPLQALMCNSAGTHLLGIAAASGTMVQVAFDPALRRLGGPQSVAQVERGLSLLFREA